MSKPARLVRERIDPRLTAALFAIDRTPVDAVLELVDIAVDSRVAGRALEVDFARRPGALVITGPPTTPTRTAPVAAHRAVSRLNGSHAYSRGHQTPGGAP